MEHDGSGGGNARFFGALSALAFGVRLSVSVVLALFVAFYLELDNPYWAGTSASIVCQPVLGASIRKGFFRLIGTTVGATVTVVVSGVYPQNRLGFLLSMGVWTGLCSYFGALAKNFAVYGFALAGYTMVIIASDSIAEPSQAFNLALTRATEIIIGIVSATLVMRLSDLRQSRTGLAHALETLIRDVTERFRDLHDDPARHVSGGYAERRALIARVAALDPVIDHVIGEDPVLRRRAHILRFAVFGLFDALSGWRVAESHLIRLDEAEARDRARPIADSLRDLAPVATRGLDATPQAKAARERGASAVLRSHGAEQGLRELDEASDVSLAILSDAASRVSSGLANAEIGLALLSDPTSPSCSAPRYRRTVADHLPAIINAIRTFLAVEAATAFWIATEWPTGLTAVVWVAISVMLFAPQQDQATRSAVGFGFGSFLTAFLGLICNFVVLPGQEGFSALALAILAFLTPVAALSSTKTFAPVMVAATINFIPMIAPTNPMVYDPQAFFNTSLAIVSGCMAGALALALVPPLPPTRRADRLFELSADDLRAIAAGRWTPEPDEWQQHIYSRLIAMPTGVDLSRVTRIVSVLTVGLQILLLERSPAEGSTDLIRSGLSALSHGDIAGMFEAFDELDGVLALSPDKHVALRTAAAVRVIRDVVDSNPSAFG